jgi:hypothetical protein
MFTVTPPRARSPYCLQRHTLLLHGCLETVVNQLHIAYSRGRGTLLGITPKYNCVQRYYPLDLKVTNNELIAFKIAAYAISYIISLAY